MTQPEKERTLPQIGKVVYRAKTHTTGGRENGASRSSDSHLDIKLSTPGSAGIGTNPEQLFAAGWSACFGVRSDLRPANEKSRSRLTWPSRPKWT